jgi:hypothetical protein
MVCVVYWGESLIVILLKVFYFTAIPFSSSYLGKHDMG